MIVIFYLSIYLEGSISGRNNFYILCLIAIPYGLGAGGVGAVTGSYIMGFALSGGQTWNMGYRYVAFIQITLSPVLFFSLPLWKTRTTLSENKPTMHLCFLLASQWEEGLVVL